MEEVKENKEQPREEPQPQEEIELPEFNWDWVMKQLEENQELNLIPFTALAVMATHIGAMDKIIQANKKPL